MCQVMLEVIHCLAGWLASYSFCDLCLREYVHLALPERLPLWVNNWMSGPLARTPSK